MKNDNIYKEKNELKNETHPKNTKEAFNKIVEIIRKKKCQVQTNRVLFNGGNV